MNDNALECMKVAGTNIKKALAELNPVNEVGNEIRNQVLDNLNNKFNDYISKQHAHILEITQQYNNCKSQIEQLLSSFETETKERIAQAQSETNEFLSTLEEVPGNIPLSPPELPDQRRVYISYTNALQILELDVIRQYPGTLFFKKYYNKEFDELGNIHFDCDNSQHINIMKYLKNEPIDIGSMKTEEKEQFLDALEYFHCPINGDVMKELFSVAELVPSILGKKAVLLKNVYYPGVNDYLRKNNLMDKLYDSIDSDPTYSKEAQSLAKNVDCKYGKLINSYLTSHTWDLDLLKESNVNYTEIATDFKKINITLSKGDKNMLYQAWSAPNVRYIFFNNQCDDVLLNVIRENKNFVNVFNACKQKMMNNNILCGNLELKYYNVIKTYLDTKTFQLTPVDKDMKYCDLIKEFKMILPLSGDEELELMNKFSENRFIYIQRPNERLDFPSVLNATLKEKKTFTTLFDSAPERIIGQHINNGVMMTFVYIVMNLNYYDFVDDYLKTGTPNVNIIDAMPTKDLKSFTDEVVNKLGFNKDDFNDVFAYFKKAPKPKNDDNNDLIPGSNMIYLKQLPTFGFSIKNPPKLLYNTVQDGYSCEAFHRCCDDKKNTFVYICGQNAINQPFRLLFFTTQLWNVVNGQTRVSSDPSCYLYIIESPSKKNGKLKVTNNGKDVIMTAPGYGPILNNTLYIPDMCNKTKMIVCQSDAFEFDDDWPLVRILSNDESTINMDKVGFTLLNYEVFETYPKSKKAKK